MTDTPIRITVDLPAFEAYVMDSGHPEDPGELPSCKRCLTGIAEGETIVYLAGRRMHERCARRLLTVDHPADAWLVIARHVAQYPSRHDAGTIRTVLNTLIDMASAELDKANEPGTGKGAA